MSKFSFTKFVKNSINSKNSLTSKKSKSSGSFPSEHGSKFGRSISRFPKQNDPELVKTLSTVNSRVIQTFVNFNVSDIKIPDLTEHEATDLIRIVGNTMDINDYEFNFLSFWILDVLSKLIKDFQLKDISSNEIKIILIWFRFVLRFISVTGASREELFNVLKEMFQIAEQNIKEGNVIPEPEHIQIEEILLNTSKLSVESKKSGESIQITSSRNTIKSSLSQHSSPSVKLESIRSSKKSMSRKSRKERSNTAASVEKNPPQILKNNVNANLNILYTIIEVIYDVFADRFVYNTISHAYSSPSIITPVKLDIEFHDPKTLKPEPVVPLQVNIPKTPRKLSKGKDSSKKNRKPSRSASKKSSEVSEKMKNDGKKKEKSTKEKGKKENEGDKKSKADKKGTSPAKGKKSRSSSLKKSGVYEANINAETSGKKIKGKVSLKAKSEPIKKGKGGKEKKLSKLRKSRGSSIKQKDDSDAKEMGNLQAKIKLFERTPSKEKNFDEDKLAKRNQFILPLSEAIDKTYFENLIKPLIPPKEKPTDTKKLSNEKERKKSSRSSSKASKRLRGSSLKGGKTKKKKK